MSDMLPGTRDPSTCTVTISPSAKVAIFIITYWRYFVLALIAYLVGRYI